MPTLPTINLGEAWPTSIRRDDYGLDVSSIINGPGSTQGTLNALYHQLDEAFGRRFIDAEASVENGTARMRVILQPGTPGDYERLDAIAARWMPVGIRVEWQITSREHEEPSLVYSMGSRPLGRVGGQYQDRPIYREPPVYRTREPLAGMSPQLDDLAREIYGITRIDPRTGEPEQPRDGEPLFGPEYQERANAAYHRDNDHLIDAELATLNGVPVPSAHLHRIEGTVTIAEPVKTCWERLK